MVAFLWQKSKLSSWRRDEIMTSEILIWYAGDAANFPIVSLGTPLEVCYSFCTTHLVFSLAMDYSFWGLLLHTCSWCVKIEIMCWFPFSLVLLVNWWTCDKERNDVVASQYCGCALSALFPFPFSPCPAWLVTGYMLPGLFLSPKQLWSLCEYCSYVFISSFPPTPVQRDNWIVSASLILRR